MASGNNVEFSHVPWSKESGGGLFHRGGPSGPSMVTDPYFVSAIDFRTGKSIVKKVLVGSKNLCFLESGSGYFTLGEVTTGFL